MKSKVLFFKPIVLLVLAASLVCAQPGLSQAAQMAGGQSLDVAMKLIDNELNSAGKVSWTEFSHDDKLGVNYKSNLIEAEISRVNANASACLIEYHSHKTPGGKVLSGPPVYEDDHRIALGDYDYEFIVTRPDLESDASALRGGHPEWRHRIEPLVYVVRPSSGALHEFWFYDEAIANRIAKALTEVAKVCRGGRQSSQSQTGSLSDVTRVPSESMARIDLAAGYPPIKSRIPGLRCTSSKTEMSQKYNSGTTLAGEHVTITCDQGGRVLATASGSTHFPYSISSQLASSFVGAEVSGEEVFVKLLSLKEFQPEDLAELASSPIPEVRIGAAANLTDQTLLAKLAEGDILRVRQTAVRSLKDQTTLSKLAANHVDPEIRKLAVEGLSDESALAAVAIGNSNSDVRKTAVTKLSDQSTLLKVAVGDTAMDVRAAAARRITDQSALAKLATEGNIGVVREAALKDLTDQSLLEKIATGDSELSIRWAAIEKLNDQTVLFKIATGDKSALLRQVAVNHLADESILSRLAAEDSDEHVRAAAAERLKSIRRR